MSSINERYEEFKRKQVGADGQSAYVQTKDKPSAPPSPIGVNVASNPIKDRKNEAVILEGGQITTRGEFEKTRREAQYKYANEKREYLSQTKRLQAEGYTKTGTDAQGRETWERKVAQEQRAAQDAKAVEQASAKKEYSVTEQLKRGLVDYPISGFTDLGHAAEDAAAKKSSDSKIFTLGVPSERAPSQAGKVEKVPNIDKETPAVGPIKSIINLGSLGLANILGDREGAKRAKIEFEKTRQGIKERPVEYASAGIGDVADLGASAASFALRGGGKVAAKAGLEGLGNKVKQGVNKFKAYGESAPTPSKTTVDAPKGFVSGTYKVKRVGPEATAASDVLKIEGDNTPFLAEKAGIFPKSKPFKNQTIDLGTGGAGLDVKDAKSGARTVKPTKDVTPEDFGYKEAGKQDGTVQLVKLEDAAEESAQKASSLLTVSPKTAAAEEITPTSETGLLDSGSSTTTESAAKEAEELFKAQEFKSKKERRLKDKILDAKEKSDTDSMFLFDKDAKTLRKQKGYDALDSQTSKVKTSVAEGGISPLFSFNNKPTTAGKSVLDQPTRPKQDTPNLFTPKYDKPRSTKLDIPTNNPTKPTDPFNSGGPRGKGQGRTALFLDMPRPKGGGSLFGGYDKPVGSTRGRNLSVINPFGKGLNINASGKQPKLNLSKLGGLPVSGGKRGGKAKRGGFDNILDIGGGNRGRKGKRGSLF